MHALNLLDQLSIPVEDGEEVAGSTINKPGLPSATSLNPPKNDLKVQNDQDYIGQGTNSRDLKMEVHFRQALQSRFKSYFTPVSLARHAP